jgi:hypothetical protein
MITEFSQVDEALIAKLSGLTVDDGNGGTMEVPVMYIDPEVEFIPDVKPSIAIYRAGIYPDDYRWTNDKFYDNPTYDNSGDLVSVEEREAPDPFQIYYGIRLYYSYQMDGVVLTRHIMSRLRRGSFLEIGGDGYDVLFISYKNPSSTYKDFGELKENEPREFIEQYLYKVQIELDTAQRTKVNVSKELVPRLNIKP